MALSPYHEQRHDVLSQLCQFQIFLTFLAAAILLKGDRDVATSPALERFLVVSLVIPPALGAFLASPLGKHLLHRGNRARVHRALGAGLARLRERYTALRHSKVPPSQSTGSLEGQDANGLNGRQGRVAPSPIGSAAALRSREQTNWDSTDPLEA